jgi:hypothetical protein
LALERDELDAFEFFRKVMFNDSVGLPISIVDLMELYEVPVEYRKELFNKLSICYGSFYEEERKERQFQERKDQMARRRKPSMARPQRGRR